MPIESPVFSLETLELGPMENFIYLIHDHATGRVAVVDPAWEADKILARVKAQGLTITDILLTHSHHDHINGIDDILTVYDAEVHLLKSEAQFWGHYLELPSLHYGGDNILLGNTEINILHTPGHTPGSACYHVGNQLIAGDTMFVFGCGRCDLAGGDPNDMYDSLRKLKTDLSPETVLLPGHNYAAKETSTIAEQMDGNPFMNFSHKHDFVRYRMEEHDKIRSTPYHPVSKI